MKTKILFVVVLLTLFSLSLLTTAQDNNFSLPLLGEGLETQYAGILPDPILRTLFEGGDRRGFFIFYLTEMPIFPGFKEEFGITDEQMARFRDGARVIQSSQEFEAGFYEINSKLQENAAYIPTTDEKAKLESAYRYAMEQANILAADIFTDEQMQRMNGMVLALTGGIQSPFFNEKHMEVLELTDEQKEQFKAIYDETKPDRDKTIAKFSTNMQKMISSGTTSTTDIFATLGAFREAGVNLRKRRTEVLTPSQLAKVRELSRLPKSMNFSVFNLSPQWQPSSGSWQPGDAVPEQYQQEQNTGGRFPREEN